MSDLLLDPDSAAAALRNLAPDEAVTAIEPPRFYKPLSNAVDEFITEAQDSKRLHLGISAFDEQMRGIGGGHTCVIVGYSHSGKTQVFIHTLRFNADKRIALFTEDEPATLVLAKLASVQSGVNARLLEQQVAQNDRRTIDLLRAVANEDFPNLIVFDQHLDPRTYGIAWEEATQVWQHEGDAMAWDYLELINTGGETVQQKFDWVKAFGKSRNIPNIVIHQTSRSAGADGKKMTISSGSYGGEQHATFLIGVRRKKAELLAQIADLESKQPNPDREATLDSLRHDLAIHEYTISVNLVKNKRPGGGLVDEIDFEIINGTGALIQLDGMPRQYLLARQQTQPAADPGWEQQSMGAS